MDGWIDRQVDIQIDRYVDRQINRQVGRWIDRQRDSYLRFNESPKLGICIKSSGAVHRKFESFWKGH